MMFVGTKNIGQGEAVSLHQPAFCPSDDAIADVADALIAGFASGTLNPAQLWANEFGVVG
jgi:hypothetical protein